MISSSSSSSSSSSGGCLRKALANIEEALRPAGVCQKGVLELAQETEYDMSRVIQVVFADARHELLSSNGQLTVFSDLRLPLEAVLDGLDRELDGLDNLPGRVLITRRQN